MRKAWIKKWAWKVLSLILLGMGTWSLAKGDWSWTSTKGQGMAPAAVKSGEGLQK